MSYIALYRKWRPLVFEDVVEQEHVVKTLKNSIKSERIAHAYLFCGTRGTGKTTMAKIFSRAINCTNSKDGDPCNECDVCKGILSQSVLDVVEIDAASNNSVDNIREIRDEVIYAPSQAKYKVYIIDEVHMLSSGAFNALLKTLEEPPKHVVFILATTEPHKLPATILSRCQRFDFRRISLESIMKRLQDIAKSGEVSVDEEALRLIARLSDGALRDAISILDQCMALGSTSLSYDDVLAVVGMVNDIFMSKLVRALMDRDVTHVIKLIEELVMNGKDINQFVSDMVLYFRNLLICKVTTKPQEVIDAPIEEFKAMKELCADIGQDEIVLIIKELAALETSLKWATHPRILLEVTLLKICSKDFRMSEDTLLERLSVLEKRLDSGNFNLAPNLDKKENVKPSVSEPNNEAIKKQPSPFPSKVAKNSGKAFAMWDSVLNELKNSGRMVIYTNLIGSKAIQIQDKQVGIVFDSGSSFKKMIVSKPENLEVIESIVSKLIGSDVRLKCFDEEDVEENTAKKDEFFEKAQEITQKLNVPINIIDE